MRQTIKTRSFLLVSALVIIAVVTSVWRAREYFREDKQAFVEETALRQVGTTERLVRERINSLEKESQIAAERMLSSTGKSDLFIGLDDLLLVSSLEAPTGSNKNFHILSLEKNPLASQQGSLSELDAALNRVSFMIDPNGESVQLKRLAWQDGRPLFALVTILENKNARVAILNENPFDRVVRSFKGSVATSFVIDRDGIVVAHPMSAYLGVSFENHPVISEIRSQKKRFGSGTFEDLDGHKIFARYQSIEGTDLYAVLTAQTNEVFGAYYKLLGPFGILAAGILLIALAATFAFSSNFQDSVDRLKILTGRIRSGDHIDKDEVESGDKSDELEQVAGQLAELSSRLEEREREFGQRAKSLAREERISALQRMGSGLSSELKGPLAGILGHVQLLKEKSEGRDDLKKHIEFIERETRRAREVIEDLNRYSGPDHVPFEALDFYDVVVASIEQVEHRVSKMGVSIQKELQSAPTVLGLSHQLQAAIGSVLTFIGRRLELSESAPGGKRISVQLEQDGRIARLTVQAVGLKISEDEKERIFDPYFLGKTDSRETGLALSAAMGIIKAHGGQIQIGETTGFTLSLPVTELRAGRKSADSIVNQIKGLEMIEDIPAPVSLPELPKIDFAVPSILVQKDVELPLPPSMNDLFDGDSIVRPPKMEI